MRIGLPTGIGDISWCWSKLKHVASDLEGLVIPDRHPKRAHQYLELLPELRHFSYEDFNYPFIVAFEQQHPYKTWNDVRSSGFGTFYMQCNEHIMSGFRLEEWLPDLPTDFHYALMITDQMRERANKLISSLPRPRIGISAASYLGADAWKTWQREEWVEFLAWLAAIVKPCSLVFLGGAWDDLTKTVACSLDLDGQMIDLTGKTKFGEAVAIHELLDGYIGFSSGLGVIRTVISKPTFMFWPTWQVNHQHSWAPPEMLDAGTYDYTFWNAVSEVKPVVKRWLKSAKIL